MRRALVSIVIAAAACSSSKQTPDARDHVDAAPVIDAMPAPDAPAPVSSLVVGDGSATLTSWTSPSTPLGAHANVTLFLTNGGATKTAKLALSFTGAAAGDFALDAAHTTCGPALVPGDQCVVAIVFTPSATGARDAALRVTGVPIALDFPIHGDGAPAATGLTTNVSLLDFGTVELTQQAQLAILVSNAGSTTITLGARTTTAGFAVVGDNCPATLTPGGACTVNVKFAPTDPGVITGTFTAASSANDATVALRGLGERRITIALTGGGTGTVTSVPSGIACGTSCSGLFVGAVTLTATATGGGTFAGWSALCGTQATCAIPAGGSLMLDARFEAAGAKSIAITFAGAAPGIVYVQDQALNTLLTCTSSCTTVVALDAQITLDGFTPSMFSGWTGDCTATTHDCNLGTIIADRAVSVHFDRDDREVATFTPAEPVLALAYAADGHLIVGDAHAVSALDATGAVVWRTAVAGGAHDLATDAQGNIYALGGGLEKLSSSGAVTWSASITGGKLSASYESIESAVAASPDGTVIAVLVPGSGAHVVDGSGADRFTVTGISTAHGVAVAPDGTVAIAAVSTSSPDQAVAIRYTSAGAALANFDPLPGGYDAALTYDAQGFLCADTSGHSQATVSRTSAAGTAAFAKTEATTSPQDIATAVAIDSAGNVIAYRAAQFGGIPGLVLEQYDPTSGAIGWTLTKTPESWPTPLVDDGVYPRALATDGAKHVAVGGTYGYSQPWIQIFAMP